MKTLLSLLKKTVIICVCCSLAGFTSNATVFTALLSGDFNAAATWGGIVPPALVTADIVIIPPGITVTLTSAQSFTATSSLLINGTLASGTYASSLSLTGGTLSGTGAIQLDSLVLNMASGISFTGSVVAQNLISMGAGITSATNVTVNNSLTLASGVLNIAAGSLTMGSGSSVMLTGGTLTASGVGTVNLTNPYSVSYLTSSAVTGIELSGTGLDSVTVNVPGTVTLSGNTTLHGLLSLTSGSLMLNGYNLTLGSGADLSATGLGTFSGTLASDLTIAATSSLSGSLRFVSGGNVINNLTVDMASASDSASLGSGLTLNGTLNLMSGKLMLSANNLLINTSGALTGGSAASYVVTNGAGSLMMNLAAGASDTFNVGTGLNFAPMVVAAGSGSSSGNVGINLAGLVYSDGTTGSVISATNSMVSATWFVSSDATGAINYNMTAMWNAGMEVNGFDRTEAYISHFTGGAWDVQPLMASASVGASMYSMTRTGITSLSPFRVADKYSVPTVVPELSLSSDITIYPNPAIGVINFSSPEKIDAVEIYNLTGSLVKSSDLANNSVSVIDLPSGMYVVHIIGADINTMKKFFRQ